MSFIQFISSRSFCSSGKNSPTLFHVAFPQLPQGPLASSPHIMSAWQDVFRGCPAFRVVHSFAYCSKLDSGLPIEFRGFKSLSVPIHLFLLLDMLCSWHLNYGVLKLVVSNVFLNRISSQTPSFSSCKPMSQI